MVKKIFIGALMWFVSLNAEAVVRLIPLAGAAQDIPVASLRKVVFTADSIVFVQQEPNSIQQSAFSSQTSIHELPNAVYKYEYSTMLFVTAEPTDIERVGVSESCESIKFIQDGRLYIRRDNKIYDVLGNPIQ